MNTVRQIQALNKRELEKVVPPSASWHTDYRDTAYVYIGGLSYDLTEGDIITIFSQYGEPVFLKLHRDKETGKSKGFAHLKYEDQRSTDLAVDNLGGTTLLGRVLTVDHTRYKKRDDEDDEEFVIGKNDEGKKRNSVSSQSQDEKAPRPKLKEEKELEKLIRDYDDEDPMKDYLIQEKKEDITKALVALQKDDHGSSSKKRCHHHHHHRHHDRHREEGRKGSPHRRQRSDR